MVHPPNRSAQIGNICIQWANLEYQLAVCIWRMAGLPMEVGKILTASMDAKQRATAAFAIAHELNAPVYLKIAIKSALKQLRDHLIDDRNRAVHGIHFPADQPDAVMLEMHRGKGGRQRKLQTDKELAQLGSAINKLSKSFNAVLGRYVKNQGAGLRATRDMLLKIDATAADAEISSQSQ